jgi:hypothetical protein
MHIPHRIGTGPRFSAVNGEDRLGRSLALQGKGRAAWMEEYPPGEPSACRRARPTALRSTRAPFGRLIGEVQSDDRFAPENPHWDGTVPWLGTRSNFPLCSSLRESRFSWR